MYFQRICGAKSKWSEGQGGLHRGWNFPPHQASLQIESHIQVKNQSLTRSPDKRDWLTS